MAFIHKAGPGVPVTLPIARLELTGVDLVGPAAVVADVEGAQLLPLNRRCKKAFAARSFVKQIAVTRINVEQIQHDSRFEVCHQIRDDGGPSLGEDRSCFRGQFRVGVRAQMSFERPGLRFSKQEDRVDEMLVEIG